MRNPIRRNKNIGTSKQGYGQNNQLVIPSPFNRSESFFERLDAYTVVEKEINSHTFRFVVEATRTNSFHACTIEDLATILRHIPQKDYGDLELIILRQPKRKEENLSSVWGRLIYSYEFENEYGPAIIIESQDLAKKLKWTKKLDPDSQKELKRLQVDGHTFETGKRFHEAELDLINIRATQLYRTLLHEWGHYAHYLTVVERPESDEETMEEELRRWDQYIQLPSSEKEVFAHSYADKLKNELTEKGVIPFDRIVDEKAFVENRLQLNDFVPSKNK